MFKKITSAKDILDNHNFLERFTEKKKYVNFEFQDFGIRLASRLNDPKHKALYINFAKSLPRGVLEQAVIFALDYPKRDAKAKIFMWKLNELCKLKNIKMPARTYKRKKKNDQIKLFK